MRTGRSRPSLLGGAMGRQLASACMALLLVVAGTWAIRRIAGRAVGSNATEALALPRKALTPGSTRAVQVADLCEARDLDNDPPVNPTLEQAVFAEYGVPAASRNSYELDYLITPALGGAADIQNLWPQPDASTWNARAKDRLEDHLHALVCQGKLQLATAQADMASDWIAAYKRYFRTDRPEPGSSAAAIVRPGRESMLSRRIRAELPASSM